MSKAELDHQEATRATMRFYWFIEDAPGLSELPRGEQRRIWQAANFKLYRHWQMWLAIPGVPLCAYIGAALGGRTGGAIGLGVGMLIFYLVVVNLLPPLIRAVLSDSGSRPS
jgi:hypothetical protein